MGGVPAHPVLAAVVLVLLVLVVGVVLVHRGPVLQVRLDLRVFLVLVVGVVPVVRLDLLVRGVAGPVLQVLVVRLRRLGRGQQYL